MIAEPEVSNGLLEFPCEVLGLEPAAHWQEALRVGFLPAVPGRNRLADPTWWEETEFSFTDGAPEEADLFGAAWQLIFDGLLQAYGFYDPEEKLWRELPTAAEAEFARAREIKAIFSGLADATSAHTAPELRIAHCIRDLAYGAESRVDDLAAMVNSDDPAYRDIFIRCYWLPTPEEAARERNQ